MVTDGLLALPPPPTLFQPSTTANTSDKPTQLLVGKLKNKQIHVVLHKYFKWYFPRLK